MATQNHPKKDDAYLFADVVLPIKTAKIFTYALPKHAYFQDKLGHRVIVPFRKHIAIGIVWHLHKQKPAHPVKEIVAFPDTLPIWAPQQRTFIAWLAHYYMCNIGQVVRMALGSIRTLFQAVILLGPTYHPTTIYLPEVNHFLALLVQKRQLTWQEALSLLPKNEGIHILTTLAAEQTIWLAKPLYNPQAKIHVALDGYNLAMASNIQFPRRLTSREEQAVAHYLANAKAAKTLWVPLACFPKNLQTAIYPLVKEGMFIKAKRFETPDASTTASLTYVSPPTPKHWEALQKRWKTKKVILVAGKGITEHPHWETSLFLQPIPQYGQALYLVPEKRKQQIKKMLPQHPAIAFYHPALTQHQKHGIWHGIAQNTIHWVVGTRAALFLPFKNLQRLVIAEEQDEQYAPQTPPPTFHARDVAIMLAHMHNAATLLATHTPSLASYYNARIGKYGWLHWTGKPLPSDAIRIINNWKKPPQLLAHVIRTKIAQTLEEKRKVIMLVHQKGYASYHICKACAWIPRCPNCHVSLTFHQHKEVLLCHYCAHTQLPHPECPLCGNRALKQGSPGIEQWAELLRLLFPSKKVLCIDQPPHKKGHAAAMAAFAQNQTHMCIALPSSISFLPLNRQHFIVIPDIDRWLHIPHFKAEAYCYRWLAQLTRHAHTATKDTLWLQTYDWEPTLIRHLVRHITCQTEEVLYKQMLQERLENAYPPYTNMLYIMLQHHNSIMLHTIAKELVTFLQTNMPVTILKPQPHQRIKRYTISLALKVQRKEAAYYKNKLKKLVEAFAKEYKGTKVRYWFMVV